jgi:hypothetical protein
MPVLHPPSPTTTKAADSTRPPDLTASTACRPPWPTRTAPHAPEAVVSAAIVIGFGISANDHARTPPVSTDGGRHKQPAPSHPGSTDTPSHSHVHEPGPQPRDGETF